MAGVPAAELFIGALQGLSLTLLGELYSNTVRETRGNMAVTRDDVIQTAIQLLNEVGLDGLTLRRWRPSSGSRRPPSTGTSRTSANCSI